MTRPSAVLFVALFALAACNEGPAATPTAAVEDPRKTPAPPPMPGSDQDAHGCKPSAGYTWCARSTRCERPWELIAANNLENSHQAFKDWCDADADKPMPPTESD